MARIPSGEFVMGSPASEAGRNAYEGPQIRVNVPAFAIGVYEVTNAEWNACAADGACPKKSGEANMPVLGVSWREASDYAAWLTKKSGRNYRLPSEAEWEYAARAGTIGAYWWGEKFDRSRVTTGAPAAVGTSDENPFGLYDVIGNAREWVADCYMNNFTKLPTDGKASTDGDCGKRVIRGGAWSSAPVDLRIANRSRIDAGVRAGYMGLRVASESKK
jgi:formylglycine-generating enzyme required for sulfatase activity